MDALVGGAHRSLAEVVSVVSLTFLFSEGRWRLVGFGSVWPPRGTAGVVLVVLMVDSGLGNLFGHSQDDLTKPLVILYEDSDQFLVAIVCGMS